MVRLYYFSFFLVIILLSCQLNNKENVIVISDEDITNQSANQNNDTLSKPVLEVAVSAIISPKETFRYYSELFEYISQKIGYEINFKQRKTYAEVNKMLILNEVDLAFICSGAYIAKDVSNLIEILAVPVCNEKPFYQAYVIANKESNIELFTDFKNKSFAFTDPLSNSGRLYVVNKLKKLDANPDSFFSSFMYTYGHDISMQLVSKKMIDGATIDGLIYEYKKKINPDEIKNIKIIEKSEFFGIPPIVAPIELNDTLKIKLQEILFNIHTDSTGKAILNKLLIEKFIPGDDNNYNNIRNMHQ